MWTEYDRKVGFFMFGMWTFNMSVAWLYLQNNVQENHRVMSSPFPLPYAYGAEMEPRDNWLSAADDVYYSQCKDLGFRYPIWGFQRSIPEVGSHRFLNENKISWEPQMQWAKMFSNNGSTPSH
eukprot:g15137.t1